MTTNASHAAAHGATTTTTTTTTTSGSTSGHSHVAHHVAHGHGHSHGHHGRPHVRRNRSSVKLSGAAGAPHVMRRTSSRSSAGQHSNSAKGQDDEGDDDGSTEEYSEEEEDDKNAVEPLKKGAAAAERKTGSTMHSDDDEEDDDEEDQPLVMRKSRTSRRQSPPPTATSTTTTTSSRTPTDRDARQGRSRSRGDGHDSRHRTSRQQSAEEVAQMNSKTMGGGGGAAAAAGGSTAMRRVASEGSTHSDDHATSTAATTRNKGGFGGFAMTEFNARGRERVNSAQAPPDPGELSRQNSSAAQTPAAGVGGKPEQENFVASPDPIVGKKITDTTDTASPSPRVSAEAEVDKRTSYPFPAVQSGSVARDSRSQQHQRVSSPAPAAQAPIPPSAAAARPGATTPPSETATLNNSIHRDRENATTPVRSAAVRQVRHHASTPPPSTVHAEDQATDLPSSSSRHIRTRNSHSSLKSLASLRGWAPPHPLSSPGGGGGRRRVTSLHKQLVAPPTVDSSQAIYRSGVASPTFNEVEGSGSGSSEMTRSTSAISMFEPSSSTNLVRPGSGAAASNLRKTSFSSSSGAMPPPPLASSHVNGTNGTRPEPRSRLTARGVAEAAVRMPTSSSSRLARPEQSETAGTERSNALQTLVSRFTNTVSVGSTDSSVAAGQVRKGVFGESPFTAGHASLCKTLKEEGAVFIAPGTPLSAMAPYIQGNLSSLVTPPSAAANSHGFGMTSTTTNATSSRHEPVVGEKGAVIWGLTPLEMSVYRCLEQRKGAVKLATGGPLPPLSG